MRAVLRTRADKLTNRKASDDPADIVAGVKDCQAILNEMHTHAEELAKIKEKLEAEAAEE